VIKVVILILRTSYHLLIYHILTIIRICLGEELVLGWEIDVVDVSVENLMDLYLLFLKDNDGRLDFNGNYWFIFVTLVSIYCWIILLHIFTKFYVICIILLAFFNPHINSHIILQSSLISYQLFIIIFLNSLLMPLLLMNQLINY
jgi:hypothetical protein